MKTVKNSPKLVMRNGQEILLDGMLAFDMSSLTPYDHIRISLERAGLVACHLRDLRSRMTPVLADHHNMNPIQINIEEILEHLYIAAEILDGTKK